MAVTTGDLRERVYLDKPTQTDNGRGGFELGWAPQFERNAHVRYLRGGEGVQAARMSGKQPAVFTVRSDPQTKLVDTGWRLRDARLQTLDLDLQPLSHRGLYNITSAIESDDRAWIEITAVSGVGI